MQIDYNLINRNLDKKFAFLFSFTINNPPFVGKSDLIVTLEEINAREVLEYAIVQNAFETGTFKLNLAKSLL